MGQFGDNRSTHISQVDQISLISWQLWPLSCSSLQVRSARTVRTGQSVAQSNHRETPGKRLSGPKQWLVYEMRFKLGAKMHPFPSNVRLSDVWSANSHARTLVFKPSIDTLARLFSPLLCGAQTERPRTNRCNISLLTH